MPLLRRRGYRLLNTNVQYSINFLARHMCQDKTYERMRILNENPVLFGKDSDAVIQVVGNGSRGISEGVLLRFRKSRILFNCGECADPFIKGIVSDVLVTHLNWVKIGGLLGLIYKAKSSNRLEMSLCGPPGLDFFMDTCKRFLLTKNFTINFMDSDSIKSRFNNFDVYCVPIRNKVRTQYLPPPVDKSWIKRNFVAKYFASSLLNRKPSGKVDLDVSYSYICETESNRAWVLSACVKMGIKPGENMQKLWRGESVLLDDGTVVMPEDVITTEANPNVIVIDCPTEGFLDDLLSKEDYEKFYKSIPLIIIHFSPSNVIKDKRYISWMKRFSQETKHVIANDSNIWSPPGKVVNRQEVFRMISPRFFPKLRLPSDLQKADDTPHWIQFGDFINDDNSGGANVVDQLPSESWLRFWKELPKDLHLIQSWPGTILSLKDQSVVRFSEAFVISQLPQINEGQLLKPLPFGPQNPRITFLGTCSQGSSRYRNTSAILVQMSSSKSMLLDCGDGTMLQLASLFDEASLQRVLTSIRCIYISHTHADHHAGLVGVLSAIRKASVLSKKPPQKVLLLLPPPLIRWFEEYNNKFQPILDHVILFNLSELLVPDQIMSKRFCNLLKKTFDMKDVRICFAKHSAFSFCATFEHMSGWKISYSGDSRYNDRFIEMGQNSDLLIHEATYATGLNKMAEVNKHSTTEDAIRAGVEMNAKQVILTHFSRRYPVVPKLKDLRNTINVSVAFDFLQVNLDDVHLLPKLNDSYEAVFEQYLTEIEEMHSKMVTRQLTAYDLSEK